VHSQSGAVDDLKIRSVRDGDRHVMALVGSLDRTTGEQLEDELKRVEATDTAEILVDLSGVGLAAEQKCGSSVSGSPLLAHICDCAVKTGPSSMVGNAVAGKTAWHEADPRRSRCRRPLLERQAASSLSVAGDTMVCAVGTGEVGPQHFGPR